MIGLSLSTHQRANPRRGASLVELVVSLMATSLLIMGLASALFLTVTALNRSTSPDADGQAKELTRRIADDLNVATALTERTATAITLTVPDRTGDGLPDTIRYSWSTVSGDPLLYQLNGGASRVLAGDVRKLNFTFLTRTLGSPPASEGSEQLLASQDPTTNSTYDIKSSAWIAEYFVPVLPNNAVSWKVTRAEIFLATGTGPGNAFIEIRATDALNQPTGPVLASFAPDLTAVTSSGAWVSVPFSPVAGLSPGDAMAILVTSTSASNLASVPYFNNVSPAMSGLGWTTSSDAGASWATPTSSRSMRFRVYGTVSTQGS